ncbi:MAG: hypothetical protein NTY14_01910 [Candidatus Omnitrophica bacterium]|nr:hypothetical protein [Candidatus Omnitrophota bacterium]
MDKKKSLSIINTYHLVFQALRSQPKLFIPYICFVLVELAVLFLLYVAPRHPFNVVLAPPIKAFFGEAFLHYPTNFLLLPKLSSLSRNFLSCILGALMTGFAVLMVSDAYNQKTVRPTVSLKSAFKKYFSLFTIVLVITGLFFGLLKLVEMGFSSLLFLKPKAWLGPVVIAINILVVLLIQGLFAYSIPLLVLENNKVFQAMGRSLGLFFKLFLPTVVLIGLPLLTYIPIIVLQYNTPLLISKVFPEAVLYVCILAAVLNSFVIDLLITVSTTVLFLQNRDSK